MRWGLSGFGQRTLYYRREGAGDRGLSPDLRLTPQQRKGLRAAEGQKPQGRRTAQSPGMGHQTGVGLGIQGAGGVFAECSRQGCMHSSVLLFEAGSHTSHIFWIKSDNEI